MLYLFQYQGIKVQFGEMPKIWMNTEQAGKLGRINTWDIVFLYPNREMCNLHHMLEKYITYFDNVENTS